MIYRHFKNRYYLRLWDVRNADDCSDKYVQYLSLYENDFPMFQPRIRKESKFYENKEGHGERYKKLNIYETAIFLLWFIPVAIFYILGKIFGHML